MDKQFIDHELITGCQVGQFAIGSVIIGALSNTYARIINIIDNSLFIVILPFRLERQFNNVLFKMFER